MTIFDQFQTRTVDLYAGVIRILCDAGIGRWSETEELTEDPVPAIFIGTMGVTPTRALGINIYTLDTDIERGVDKMGLAVLIRTPEKIPLKAVELADKLEDVFHGREHDFMESWHLPVMWRHSLADLGPNEQGHYQISDTYHFYVDVYREAVNHD